jgi:hypothetical protein
VKKRLFILSPYDDAHVGIGTGVYWTSTAQNDHDMKQSHLYLKAASNPTHQPLYLSTHYHDLTTGSFPTSPSNSTHPVLQNELFTPKEFRARLLYSLVHIRKRSTGK